MIVFTRTMHVRMLAATQAIDLAKKIAVAIKEKLGVELETTVPVAGNPARIAWTARYDSLADLESYLARLLELRQDSTYRELIGKFAETCVPDTFEDTIWRTV
ncbi:MAG: hypothetical protein ABSC95_14930 [Acetobacteraceae bacterium]|jgi:hypothetical protein